MKILDECGPLKKTYDPVELSSWKFDINIFQYNGISVHFPCLIFLLDIIDSPDIMGIPFVDCNIPNILLMVNFT